MNCIMIFPSVFSGAGFIDHKCTVAMHGGTFRHSQPTQSAAMTPAGRCIYPFAFAPQTSLFALPLGFLGYPAHPAVSHHGKDDLLPLGQTALEGKLFCLVFVFGNFDLFPHCHGFPHGFFFLGSCTVPPSGFGPGFCLKVCNPPGGGQDCS